MKQILANKSLLDPLFSAMKSGKLAGCYIIEGAKGTGKRTIARWMASALMCTSPLPDGTPCFQCHACKCIADGGHIDVFELRPEEEGKSISVDAVRAMLAQTHFLPVEGDWRVLIVEHAESMKKAAQSALLKSIEEPRPNHVFFLLTEDMSKLLPTVRSRGVKLRTELLSREVIQNELIRRGAASDEAEIAAQLSGGSLGKGISLLSDSAIKKNRERVIEYFTALMNGAGFTKLCLILPPAKTTRAELSEIVSLVKIGLRDLICAHFGFTDPEFFADPTLLRDLSQIISPRAAMRFYQLAEDLEKSLEQNANLFSALSGFHLTAAELTR